MNAPQGSVEWKKARAGHCTASRFGEVMARIKTGEAATRRKYRVQLVTERLTGMVADSYKSASMQWGIETEPLARLAYEARYEPVIETGFLLHPAIDWCGASPDGLVGDEGLAEIKCPDSTTHIESLLDGLVPSEYIPQIQGQMAVTGRKWADFVSFDPRFPKHLQLLVVRVQRDDAYIAELERQIKLFLHEVDQLHDRLLNGGAMARAA